MLIIFCANQVSLSIAVSLLRARGLKKNDVIFFDGSRCDILIYKKLGIHFITLTKWNFLKFIIANFFRRPDEVCLPHFFGRKLIRVYARYAKKLSAIDDGLDTFRDVPSNINIADFKQGSNYYTFNYDSSLALWLNNFNLMKVCAVESFAESIRCVADLNEYDGLVVESPGIEALDFEGLNLKNIFVIKHSNPNKNILNDKKLPYVLGSEIALEKTIENYRGTLIVGESMVAVYALMLKSPQFKLIVTLKRKSMENLPSLVSIINRCRIARLLVSR